jgi:hypothetical protein
MKHQSLGMEILFAHSENLKSSQAAVSAILWPFPGSQQSIASVITEQ